MKQVSLEDYAARIEELNEIGGIAASVEDSCLDIYRTMDAEGMVLTEMRTNAEMKMEYFIQPKETNG